MTQTSTVTGNQVDTAGVSVNRAVRSYDASGRLVLITSYYGGATDGIDERWTYEGSRLVQHDGLQASDPNADGTGSPVHQSEIFSKACEQYQGRFPGIFGIPAEFATY